MGNARYFEEQSQRCYRLARGCFDLSVAEKLNAMGDEFRNKAHELATQWSVAVPPAIKAE
jgi:hypothetical protein